MYMLQCIINFCVLTNKHVSRAAKAAKKWSCHETDCPYKCIHRRSTWSLLLDYFETGATLLVLVGQTQPACSLPPPLCCIRKHVKFLIHCKIYVHEYIQYHILSNHNTLTHQLLKYTIYEFPLRCEFRMAETNQDWESILTKLQRDANECINLFEELENGRTPGECMSDLVVGDRAKINPERLLIYMKKFQKEVKTLLSIYTTLSRKVKWGKTLELGYQENMRSNFQLDYFKEGIDASIEKQFNEFSLSIPGKEAKEQTCKLKTTGIVVGGAGVGAVVGVGGTALAATSIGATLSSGIAALGLVIPDGIGLVFGSIAAIAHHMIHSSGRERGLDYQTVKLLYDSFHNNRLLSSLESLSSKMEQLSENVDMQIETYKLEFGTHQQAIEQKNAGKEIAKATKLYFKTLSTEIEQLKSSEPGMGEDMRKRMATKIAASSCRTFLKQSLNYSDSDAQEFINDLQS